MDHVFASKAVVAIWKAHPALATFVALGVFILPSWMKSLVEFSDNFLKSIKLIRGGYEFVIACAVGLWRYLQGLSVVKPDPPPDPTTPTPPATNPSATTGLPATKLPPGWSVIDGGKGLKDLLGLAFRWITGRSLITADAKVVLSEFLDRVDYRPLRTNGFFFVPSAALARSLSLVRAYSREQQIALAIAQVVLHQSLECAVSAGIKSLPEHTFDASAFCLTSQCFAAGQRLFDLSIGSVSTFGTSNYTGHTITNVDTHPTIDGWRYVVANTAGLRAWSFNTDETMLGKVNTASLATLKAAVQSSCQLLRDAAWVCDAAVSEGETKAPLDHSTRVTVNTQAKTATVTIGARSVELANLGLSVFGDCMDYVRDNCRNLIGLLSLRAPLILVGQF